MLEMQDICPICNALVTYSTGAPVSCPHCKNELLVGSSDPGWHDISEIDPDVSGGIMGVFHLNLHPRGTKVCVQCQQIYPATFECCPNLVDLAFASFNHPSEAWGPDTKSRIEAFLRKNVLVVTNTAKLRILESQDGSGKTGAAHAVRECLESLGLLNFLVE